MKKHSIGLVFVAAAVFLAPMSVTSGSAWAQQLPSRNDAPRIERFDLDRPSSLAAGEALIFVLAGTARGTASVTIEGATDRVALTEVMPGVYEGVYTIKTGDRIVAASVVTGSLRRGTQELSATLGQPLVVLPVVATLR